MARILLVPFGPPEHTDPMGTLGVALRGYGHQVSVFTEDPRYLRRRGFELPTVTPIHWRSSGAVPASLLATRDGAALFQYMFFGSVVDMTRDIQTAAGECHAEMIISDVLMPGAGLAAALSGLPWVSLSCSPVPTPDAYRVFVTPYAIDHVDASSALAQLGLPAGGHDNLLSRTSPLLHLIPTTPRFAGSPVLPDGVALVGPLASGHPVPATGRGDRPTIAVTASTAARAALGGRTFTQDRYLRTVVAALDGLDVEAVVTLPGGFDRRTLGPVPPNVRLTGALASDALFDRCAAVVCHAGWDTVSRALVRGLPLVLAPISGDQPYIAERCDALGIAVTLEPVTMRAAQVRAAIREVCEGRRHRRYAEEFAADLAATAPLDGCTSLITSLLAGERLGHRN